LIEALLLYRHLRAEQVRAGLRAAVAVGETAANFVAGVS
jgi:hypothetical protein